MSDFSAVFKHTDLSKRVQRHLVDVYRTLSLAVLFCVVGVVTDMRLHFGGQLSALAGILTMVALGMQPKEQMQKRLGLLSLFGFLQGASMGPLIQMAIRVDPAILFTAVVGTLAVFACFSASAIFSARRSYMYLGGILGSALSFLCILSLVQIFFSRSVVLYQAHLYLGLAVFCAFVLYDTVSTRYEQLLNSCLSLGQPAKLSVMSSIADCLSSRLSCVVCACAATDGREGRERLGRLHRPRAGAVRRPHRHLRARAHHPHAGRQEHRGAACNEHRAGCRRNDSSLLLGCCVSFNSELAEARGEA